MNLDELQSVQSRERQTDSLQQLRETFYGDAGEFIQQLRDEREAAAERADDPFDAPEVNRLSDDIKTAEQTVEAIYERRVGKIVKMASLAAADMPAEEEGLTREERDLFETLVGAIENNRDHVLDVLAGEASPGAVTSGSDSPTEQSASGDQPRQNQGPQSDEQPRPDESEPPATSTPDRPSASGEPAVDDTQDPGPATEAPTGTGAGASADGSSVDAADVMGTSGDETDLPPEIPPDEPPGTGAVETDDPLANDPGSPASDGGTVPSPPSEGASETATPQSPDDEPSESATPAVDRTTVRITDDVGEIFGIDQREYDLSTNDVVTLPEQNATPLIERDAAESIE